MLVFDDEFMRGPSAGAHYAHERGIAEAAGRLEADAVDLREYEPNCRSVNIDFDVVYRSLTSLDGVLQAGGRCNRDGKRKNPGRVYLFMYMDEKLEKMPVLQKEREASLEALRKVYGSKRKEEALDIGE